MSQYDYSKEKSRGRAFKRIRGVILLLLVLGLLVWGVTALIRNRSNTKQPAPPTTSQEVKPGDIQQEEQPLPGQEDPDDNPDVQQPDNPQQPDDPEPPTPSTSL